jgi:hypothetical protein
MLLQPIEKHVRLQISFHDKLWCYEHWVVSCSAADPFSISKLSIAAHATHFDNICCCIRSSGLFCQSNGLLAGATDEPGKHDERPESSQRPERFQRPDKAQRPEEPHRPDHQASSSQVGRQHSLQHIQSSTAFTIPDCLTNTVAAA